MGECVLVVKNAESRANLLKSWPYRCYLERQVADQSAPQFPHLKNGGHNTACLQRAVRSN